MSLANVAALLAKEKAVKSTGALAQVIKGLNEAKDSGGLDAAKDIMTEMTNVGMSAQIFQLILGEIKAGTTQESAELFREVLTLMQNDSAHSFMNTVESILNRIIGNAGDLVALLNRFDSLTAEGGAYARFMQTVENYVLGPLEAVLNILNDWADAAERIRDAVTGTTYTTPPNAPPDAPQDGTFWDWIVYTWNKAMGQS